jgi:DNA polymerase-3 subunit gamma/tau
VLALATPVIDRNPQKALEVFAQAMAEGSQLGDLLDQLIDYWRDLMVVHCAGGGATDLSVPARHREILTQQAQALPLDTILAGLDILNATKARLRNSSHGRVLMEMVLIRLGRLHDLASLSQLASWLGGGEAPSRKNAGESPDAVQPSQAATLFQPHSPVLSPVRSPNPKPAEVVEKKNPEPGPELPGINGQEHISEETLPRIWQEVLKQLGPILAKQLEKIEAVAISGPKTLVLHFESRYNLQYEHCREPTFQSRIEEALRKVTGQAWNLRVESGGNGAAALPASAAETENSQSRYRRQRTEVMQMPLVKRAFDLMGAQIVQMDEGFGAAPPVPPPLVENPELEEE